MKKTRTLQTMGMKKGFEIRELIISNISNTMTDEEVIELFKSMWGEQYQGLLFLCLASDIENDLINSDIPTFDIWHYEKLELIYEALELSAAKVERGGNNED